MSVPLFVRFRMAACRREAPLHLSQPLTLMLLLLLLAVAVVTGDTSGGGARQAAASDEAQLPWGDVFCDETVNAIDALRLLRHIADFPHYPECGAFPGPDPDTTVVVDGVERTWADIDCDNEIDSVDALWILRFTVGLPVHQMEGCPAIGTLVNV